MKKMVVTTSWDDGHVLDLKLADLLSKYNLPATFYISPENREIEKENRLTKEQVGALSKVHTFEIGAHTMTHPRLSQIDDDAARKEIVDSKKYLENVLGRPVTSFCYPGGDYLPRHEAMVKNAGFSLGRTVQRFKTNIDYDPFAMPTTIHTYRHWSDIFPIFAASGVKSFFRRYFNWDELAIAIFEEVAATGGVFHLWGHSWEIEKNDDWVRLERVLKYISNHPNVSYVTNTQSLA